LGCERLSTAKSQDLSRKQSCSHSIHAGSLGHATIIIIVIIIIIIINIIIIIIILMIIIIIIDVLVPLYWLIDENGIPLMDCENPHYILVSITLAI
jgi:hypothetical protein